MNTLFLNQFELNFLKAPNGDLFAILYFLNVYFIVVFQLVDIGHAIRALNVQKNKRRLVAFPSETIHSTSSGTWVDEKTSVTLLYRTFVSVPGYQNINVHFLPLHF